VMNLDPLLLTPTPETALDENLRPPGGRPFSSCAPEQRSRQMLDAADEIVDIAADAAALKKRRRSEDVRVQRSVNTRSCPWAMTDSFRTISIRVALTLVRSIAFRTSFSVGGSCALSTDLAGGLTDAAAVATGLPAGTPVAVGAGDLPACVLGAGAVTPGVACLVVGTTCLNGVVADEPVFTPRDMGILFTVPGAGRRLRSSHPAVSAFPEIAVGSACTSTFSRLARRPLTLRPAHSRRHLYVTSYTEGFSHFVTSMTAPVASGWSVRRVGLSPTGKRRLLTAHANSGHSARCGTGQRVPRSA